MPGPRPVWARVQLRHCTDSITSHIVIGGCRICSKVGQKAREARRDFGHAPFWHTKITVMTKFSAKMRMILHVCKVEVFLVVGLFIKESNKDFLRLVAMI